MPHRSDLERQLRELGYLPAELSTDPRFRAWRRSATKRQTARTVWVNENQEIYPQAAIDAIIADASR